MINFIMEIFNMPSFFQLFTQFELKILFVSV